MSTRSGRYKRRKDSEMTVITKTKDLISYIFVITEDRPKKFRFSIIGRMQNISLEILSLLYKANETYVDMKLLKDINKSLDFYTTKSKKKGYKDDNERYFIENKILTLKLIKAQKLEEKIDKRIDFQYAALTLIKELDYIITLAREVQCITPKQKDHIAELLRDCRNLLGAWIKKTKNKYGL